MTQAVTESGESLLRAGVRELGVAEDGVPAMLLHGQLLAERNQVMNLTAIQSEADMIRLHFLDSCALLTLFPFRGKSLLDVGSGAGFPGLPLKMAEPSVRLTLLDAQRKRVDFLRDVCRETGLADVECVHARAEEYAQTRRETFDMVISRAVASLPVLAELCLPLARPGGHMLAMKSVHCEEEVQQAEHALSVLGGAVERIADYRVPGTEVVHRLLVIKKTGKTPPRYPRPFGQIKKKPL